MILDLRLGKSTVLEYRGAGADTEYRYFRQCMCKILARPTCAVITVLTLDIAHGQDSTYNYNCGKLVASYHVNQSSIYDRNFMILLCYQGCPNPLWICHWGRNS